MAFAVLNSELFERPFFFTSVQEYKDLLGVPVCAQMFLTSSDRVVPGSPHVSILVPQDYFTPSATYRERGYCFGPRQPTVSQPLLPSRQPQNPTEWRANAAEPGCAAKYLAVTLPIHTPRPWKLRRGFSPRCWKRESSLRKLPSPACRL